MAKVQYKSKEGVLHIGGGRFFYGQKPVQVSEEEKGELLKLYKDLEEVEEKESQSSEDDEDMYTEASLKKLNAEQQKEVILSMGGDPEETKNEGERIALILNLQEEQGE